ncbi:MAG: hypothetical protein JWQ86_1356 [Mycobacterium sp.]|jgi:hypothetical protein|nr:hypothetical protein [Mycobacterium sp.]MDT5111063.1 hypothetical protein [Mycobacterium sp.]MDT5212774.1 hypothetical protein [Mycobacterium sp.]MDT5391019.1 hypothetical protein [Mycobacterium sp.]MDT5397531.1 hypothetical protein [Mycobacterium sp.]
MLRTLLVVACAGLLTACASGESTPTTTDIAKVLDVKSSFGPAFKVSTFGPAGVDPHLLSGQALPPGVVFDPADCAKVAAGLTVPEGLKGNMAATTAEGEGNRFITIAVETSEALPFPDPGDACKKFAFAANGMRGLDEVVESPTIDGVRTLGTHRVVQTMVNGKPASGELYNYVAAFGNYRVIVTANPLVDPSKPVVPVNTQRASDLLSASVKAIRGN